MFTTRYELICFTKKIHNLSHNFIRRQKLELIGRNVKHVLGLFDELSHLGVHVISLRENLDFSSPVGQMVLTIMASIAQLERQILAERIKTALAAKKLKAQRENSDWRCGRPPLSKDIKDRAIELRKQGLSIRQVAKKLNVGKTSVERALRGQR